jgi:hypothetical protein
MRRITLLLRRPLWWVPVLNWITLGVRLRWWGIGWLLVLFRARHWDVRGRSVVHWRGFGSFRAWHLGWQVVGRLILDCDRIGLLRWRPLIGHLGVFRFFVVFHLEIFLFEDSINVTLS